VLALVEAGEPALAQTYAQQFGLPDNLIHAAPAAVAAVAEVRAAAHLPLDLPADRVLLADEDVHLDRCVLLVFIRILFTCMTDDAQRSCVSRGNQG
jgi:hypothetical protein